MKVIILKDVKGVGVRGAVVEVADGFALNSLIPQGKAVQATPEKVAEVERRMAAEKASSDARGAKLLAVIRSLDGKEIRITAKANEHGHLFKAIKREDIARELSKSGVEITKDALQGSGDTIKSVGEYSITVSAGSATVTVRLVVVGQ